MRKPTDDRPWAFWRIINHCTLQIHREMWSSQMGIPGLNRACQQVAEQVRDSMRYFHTAVTAGNRVYALALVNSDDLGYTMLYANTEQRRQRKIGSNRTDEEERILSKWYFGTWEYQGDEINTSRLQTALPVEPGYENEDYAALRGALYLWALTASLRLLADKGLLVHHDEPVIAFCSMVDSEEAVWIERETSRYINPAPLYAAVAPEQRLCAKYWYRSYCYETTKMERFFAGLRGTAANGVDHGE